MNAFLALAVPPFLFVVGAVLMVASVALSVKKGEEQLPPFPKVRDTTRSRRVFMLSVAATAAILLGFVFGIFANGALLASRINGTIDVGTVAVGQQSDGFALYAALAAALAAVLSCYMLVSRAGEVRESGS